jgi:hypothetical protein
MQPVSLVFLSFLLFFLFPHKAFAWGPGSHLQFSLDVLKNLSLIAPYVAAIIEANRNDFLYGGMAADIIFGKKFLIEHRHHCHNWKVGQKILESATTNGQIACAYGYLAHLAADVISHNYYVPIQMIKSFRTRLLRHAYWETRYDATLDHSIWTLAAMLAKEGYKENDELLEKTLKRTIFSFKTNKRIFNHLLILQDLRHWRIMIDSLAAISTWKLPHKEIQDFKELSENNMISFLIDPANARCCGADPTGHARLDYAKEVRKKLKKFRRRGILTEHKINQIIKDFDLILRQAIYDSKPLPPVEDVIGIG